MADAISAQERQIWGGLGISFPQSHRDGHGLGGSLVYEQLLVGPRWASVRAYGGAFFSRSDQASCVGNLQVCDVSSQIGVGGAKVRFLVPIPYVAPFIEVGAGLSAGSITTRIPAYGSLPEINEGEFGLLFHIPAGLGLAFGRRHQHKISLDYFSYPGQDHVTGTVSLGIGL
jgi:hypothetical protein